MKRISIGILTATFVLTMLALGAQKTQDVERQLKAAMNTELVDGNLKAAIEQYKKVAQSGIRPLAAQALVHMAGCYEKLGDAEAQKIYERVLREYADQKDAVAVARARRSGNTGAKNAGIITRQVWTGPKADTYGSVSPDGRYLSFTDWETGDLALHDLTTGQDRRLTNKGNWLDSGEYAEESVIAPDGKRVAYSWYNANLKGFRYDLRLVSLNESGSATPRVLYDNEDIEWIGVYDWSANGKWLAVQLLRKDGTAQIGVIGAGDGVLRVLKSVDWRGSTRVFFSPDSQYVAFDLPSSQDSEQRDVFALAIDGSREIPLVVHAANDVAMAWTSDGKHVLFASDRTGSMGVWAISFRDGKPQGTPVLVKLDIGRPRAMGLTRSGALYFGVQTDGPDLYIASLDFNSGKILMPPARAIQRFMGSNRSPDWSTDGKYLAYTSRRDPVLGNRSSILAIRSMENGEVRELRPNLTQISWLRWAPDGRSLAVEGTDPRGRQGIYQVDVQTAEVSPIAQGQTPQWAPDGKRLFYRRGGGVVVERDLASRKEREVIRRENPCRMSLSPDGRYLACVDFGDQPIKGRTLWVVPTEGGEPRALVRLSEAHTFGNFTAWTPDSRWVLYWAPIGNGGPHWLVPLAGGEPRKIDLGFARAFDVRIHPDGTQVVFTAGNDKFEVWVMENFLPALSAK